jgi:CubicO group peptidase (beta-lactamase class C family)
MLAGIAIDKGFLRSENEPMYQYFERDYEPSYGWSQQARQVKIHHLLSMMSGYDCDDLATDFGCEDAMYETDDWVQYSLDLPFAHDPGQQWAYNSSSLILVGEAIARESGMKLEGFADKYLFDPLGIKKFRWNFSPKNRAWIGGGARMIPREMAKIGLLMLKRGLWNGRHLLSEEWIEKSTSKQGEMRAGVDYGYLWQSGRAFIGEEQVGAYWASGNGGQYIIVLPEQNMVVVFTGGNYNSHLASQPFEMLARHILPAFLHPNPLETLDLPPDQLEKLTGVYELDFEPTATSTITIKEEGVSLLAPDGEEIALAPHTPTLFSGDSRHGPITVVFDYDPNGDASRHTIYGNFQQFVFERR